MLYRGSDGEVRQVEVLEVRDRESTFQKACPVLPLPLAVLCFVLNLIPGAGTLAAAFLNLCFGLKKFDSPCSAFVTQILTAFLQVLTAPLVIGIIWSIRYEPHCIDINLPLLLLVIEFGYADTTLHVMANAFVSANFL